MKTIEFRANLTPAQSELIESWFPKLKLLWNIALGALEEFEAFHYYDKHSKTNAPCCPLPWDYRAEVKSPDESDPKTKGKKKKTVDKKEYNFYPYCTILNGRSRWYQKQMPRHTIPTPAAEKDSYGWYCEDGGSGYSCPIYRDYQEPIIQGTNKFGLSPLSKEETLQQLNFLYPGATAIAEVGQKYRMSLLQGLAIAWQEYVKSRSKTTQLNRGRPKFKRKRDRITTLSNTNPPKATKQNPNYSILEGDYFKAPILGKIHVTGLQRRWINGDGTKPEVCAFKITKRPSGWYIQLTGEIQQSLRLHKPSKGAVGIDPGVINWITLDDGTTYKNPRWYQSQMDKIAQKQREINHKLTHNLILWLNHPNRKVEDINKVIAIANEKAKTLLTCKTEKAVIELIGASRFQRLRHNPDLESNRLKKLKKELSLLHEKASQARKSYAHKHSTWLVRKYETIVCEHGEQQEKLRRKAKPKKDEKGRYTQNKAKAKSGLSRSLADTGHGDFMAKCEVKAKAAERSFIRYPARNTTKQCPVCDHLQEIEANYPGQMIECENCGYTAGRDRRPGILMLIQTYEQGKVNLEQLTPEVQQAIALRNARKGSCGKGKKTKKP